jgi:hypothetical protein
MDLLLRQPTVPADDHQEAIQDRRGESESILPVVLNPVNSVHESLTKTKAKIEVGHDRHLLPLPTDPLQNHHQGEERHHQIVRPEEHLHQKVSTVRHPVDSLSQEIVRMTNVDSSMSAAKEEVDHPPDVLLRPRR